MKCSKKTMNFYEKKVLPLFQLVGVHEYVHHTTGGLLFLGGTDITRNALFAAFPLLLRDYCHFF